MRKSGKPLPYILGETFFLDIKLFVNNATLVPRPETEELVLKVIEEQRDKKFFLDLGSGSGAIGIALLLNVDNSFVYFSDISKVTFEVLKKNIDYYNLNDRCFFINDDFSNIDDSILKKIEVVVSNPPYVSFDEISLLDSGAYFEPTNALFAKDLCKLYTKIVNKFKHCDIYLEINPSLRSCLTQYGELTKDINGKFRILTIRKAKKVQ